MKKLTYLCCLALLCLFTNVPAQTINNKQQYVVIYGEIKSEQPIDTLQITYWDHFLDKYATIPAPEELKIRLRPGSIFDGAIGKMVFEVAIPIRSEQGLFRITHNKQLLLDHFITEPGDTLMFQVDLTKGKTIFAGPSGDKYRCQYEIMLANETKQFNEDPIMFTGSKDRFINARNNKVYYEEAVSRSSGPGRLMTFVESGPGVLKYITEAFNEDPLGHPGWDVIKAYENRIDKEFLQVLSANLWGNIIQKKLFSFNRTLKNETGYHSLYKDVLINLPIDQYSYETMIRSAGYQQYLLMQVIIQSRMENIFIPELIAAKFKGVLKDILLGKFLVAYHSRLQDLDKHLKYALAETQTTWIKESIERISDAQLVGTPLLDAPLTDINGKEIRMSDFKGKTLFIDFWFTGCSACVKFYKSYLTKLEEHFKDDDEVLMVSICSDESKERWYKSIHSGKYTSPDIINLTTGGSDHRLLKYYDIHSYPRQMIVDAEGKIYQTSGFPKDPDQLIKLLESVSNSK